MSSLVFGVGYDGHQEGLYPNAKGVAVTKVALRDRKDLAIWLPKHDRCPKVQFRQEQTRADEGKEPGCLSFEASVVRRSELSSGAREGQW
jgi:hypothetical protein